MSRTAKIIIWIIVILITFIIGKMIFGGDVASAPSNTMMPEREGAPSDAGALKEINVSATSTTTVE